jgi:Transposase IS200 like
MTRHWLITSTTYATWLPGDKHGFVSPVEIQTGERVVHNVPGTPYDQDMPELRQRARALLKCEPIYLTEAQAAVIRDQFLETAQTRGWTLHAAAVMANYFHAVIEAPSETASAKILGDLKSYASRALTCPKSALAEAALGSLVDGVRLAPSAQGRTACPCSRPLRRHAPGAAASCLVRRCVCGNDSRRPERGALAPCLSNGYADRGLTPPPLRAEREYL